MARRWRRSAARWSRPGGGDKTAAMVLLQLACVAIVALYVGLRLRGEAKPWPVLRRLTLLAVAAWIGEDSCIRGYGFYQYSPSLWPRLDQVPLVIVLIWPAVVHSAWDLAAGLTRGRPSLRPLVGGLVVLADASLIEPVAVQAGLWSWNAPGLFAVPPIGVLGWAFFAALAMAGWQRGEASERPGLVEGAAVVAAPLGSHLLLIGAWWGGCRWVSGPIPPWPAVGLLALVTVGAAGLLHRRQARRRIPLRHLLLRLPPSLFFLVLLLLHGRDQLALCAWAAAFAPPYLALLDGGSRRGAAPPRA